MAVVIDQEISDNWAYYHGDCVLVMNGLPDNSIDFNLHSPPFLSLYIYSDSVADLGNSESEAQFFEGYLFALEEMYRTLKPGRSIAIHCKDTMRYMSSHGYAGLYDFPGEIIRYALEAGFLFQRWITIWKDPVVEMQRTKTYGLLHKSFAERAEVTRQGCADYVLVFQKPLYDDNDYTLAETVFNKFPDDVIGRMKHQWSQSGETVTYNELKESHLSIWDEPLSHYTDDFIQQLSEAVVPGRLCVIHCKDLVAVTAKGETCHHNMSGDIVSRFQSHPNWKFHSRCALTDGTSFVVFRNWSPEFKRNYSELNAVVKHRLQPPETTKYQYHNENGELIWHNGSSEHPDYIGNKPPTDWRDSSYYSILVWQKYASPVWFDFDGLPSSHKDIWMNIEQTNVLNQGLRDEEEQRHICPLQLDLIERLILEYTDEGEVVYSPYGGISSEGYKAILLGRKAILSELKGSYWRIGCKYLREAELMKLQPMLL